MYEIGELELKEIEALFKSKKFFRYQGKDIATNCSKFETEFCSFIGMNYSLFVTSGTNAIFLALKALGIGKGDEVLVPSYTFVATIAAVLQVEARPVVIGVGDGLTFNVELIGNNLTEKTKAIIPVHMDGFPCDMDKIMKFSRNHRLYVIEDVAQAVGGSYLEKKLGSFGDASCFSFNVDKIISCGEGGLVSFREEVHFKKALKLHDIPVSYGNTFKEYLSDVSDEIGYSMRMSEISAVIMRTQLRRLPAIIEGLRHKKNILLRELSHISTFLVLPIDQEGECATQLHLKCSDPIQAKEVTKLLNDRGIISVPLYARPVHCFWQWQNLLKNDSKHLAQDRIHLSSIVRINVDYSLSDSDLIKSAAIISDIVQKHLLMGSY